MELHVISLSMYYGMIATNSYQLNRKLGSNYLECNRMQRTFSEYNEDDGTRPKRFIYNNLSFSYLLFRKEVRKIEYFL